VSCGGVTYQCNDGTPDCVYTTRKARTLTPSPSSLPSTSWLVQNPDECHGPAPTPSPPVPNQEALRYSRAAFAGMARTDPEAVWVSGLQQHRQIQSHTTSVPYQPNHHRCTRPGFGIGARSAPGCPVISRAGWLVCRLPSTYSWTRALR